jgi:hypothetical protein
MKAEVDEYGLLNLYAETKFDQAFINYVCRKSSGNDLKIDVQACRVGEELCLIFKERIPETFKMVTREKILRGEKDE